MTNNVIGSVEDGAAEVRADPPLWRNRDYLLLSSGQIVSMAGSQVSTIAIPLMCLCLTGSARQTALVSAMASLPYLLFGLVVGVLVDRWNRRTVMIVCDLVRGALTLSLPIGYATGHLSLTWFCVTAFAGGTAFVFFSVAEVSSLSSVVGPSRLVRASSVSEVAESTASLVGPGLGGLLISLGRTPLVGGALALLVDGASFLVSMFSLLFVRTPLHSVQNPRDRGTVWKELRQGQRYVWTHPTIRTLMLIAAGLNMLFSPVYLAVILRARNDMGASPTMVGLVFSLGAAGGLLGGLLSAWLTPKLKAGTLIMGALGAWALAMPLVALANTPWLLMGAWGLVTFISPQFDVPQRSYRLSLVPQELQGRVNSSFRVVAWGVQPAAIAVGGVLLSEFGARPLLWAIAAGMLLVALGGLLSGLRHAELPSKATT